MQTTFAVRGRSESEKGTGLALFSLPNSGSIAKGADAHVVMYVFAAKDGKGGKRKHKNFAKTRARNFASSL